MSETSLYIPYIESNITHDYIQSIFEKTLSLGKVRHIRLVNKQNLQNYNIYKSAYVYFEYFNNNTSTIDFLARVSNSNNVRVTFSNYGKKFYWIILKNRSKKVYFDVNHSDIMDLTHLAKKIDNNKIAHDVESETICQREYSNKMTQSEKQDIIDLTPYSKGIDINKIILETILESKNGHFGK